MTDIPKAPLTQAARRLYGELNYLYDYWGGKTKTSSDDSFYVSTAQLMRVLKVSKSTLIRARRQLLATGMIKCANTGGRGMAIIYHLPERAHQKLTQKSIPQGKLPAIDPSTVKYLIKTLGRQRAVESYVSHGYQINDILALADEPC